MSGRPLVSVAFVTYNHADFVEEALRSAAEQDYENLEIVVGDDGSPDGTRALAANVALQYPDRVTVLPDQRHLGVVGNCNRTLAACRGKYIAFLDGDDLFLPGKISRQVEWLEEDERRVLCGHDVEAFDSATGSRLYLWSRQFGLPSGTGAAALVKHGVAYGGLSTMVRASVIPQGGYDDRLRMIIDWKLWIDCLLGGGQFGYVDGVYARYRRHGGNVTVCFSEIGRDDQFVSLALVEARHAHLAEACRYGRARLFYGLGVAALLQRRRREARRHLANSLWQGTRFRWKAALGLLSTWLPDRVLRILGR